MRLTNRFSAVTRDGTNWICRTQRIAKIDAAKQLLMACKKNTKNI